MKTVESDRSDAVQRVRSFLHRLEEGETSVEEVERIKSELREIVSRVERAKKRFPEDREPEVSPEVRRLLQELKQEHLIDRLPYLKKIKKMVASFL